MKDILVFGAGNGGYALAADLTARNFPVRLCTVRTPNKIRDLKEHGGIELSGAAGKGLFKPKIMTSNIEKAIEGVDIIFCPIPANGIEYSITKMLPYLKSDQIIILTPGAVGGALAVTNFLKTKGIKHVYIGETSTLPYGCRLVNPYHAEIYDVAKNVLFAMLPGNMTDEVLKIVKPLLPNFIKAETVIETSLNYMNYLFHPVGMVLNTGWIEHGKEKFRFYYDGISPSVARVLETMDRERLHILKKLDFKLVTFEEWMYRKGKTSVRDSIYNTVHASIPNKKFLSPDNFSHRFVMEDVPYGLVPISYFGKFVNIDMPVTDALITITSQMREIDFMKEGRNLEKMGILNMSICELKEFVSRGKLS